jgi:hypothetical protein
MICEGIDISKGAADLRAATAVSTGIMVYLSAHGAQDDAAMVHAVANTGNKLLPM